jgi:hypothetical protein
MIGLNTPSFGGPAEDDEAPFWLTPFRHFSSRFLTAAAEGKNNLKKMFFAPKWRQGCTTNKRLRKPSALSSDGSSTSKSSIGKSSLPHFRGDGTSSTDDFSQDEPARGLTQSEGISAFAKLY